MHGSDELLVAIAAAVDDDDDVCGGGIAVITAEAVAAVGAIAPSSAFAVVALPLNSPNPFSRGTENVNG